MTTPVTPAAREAAEPVCVPTVALADNRTLSQKTQTASEAVLIIEAFVREIDDTSRRFDAQKATLRAQSKRITALESLLSVKVAEIESLRKALGNAKTALKRSLSHHGCDPCGITEAIDAIEALRFATATTATPETVSDWRMLEVGDTIENGDEWLSSGSLHWRPSFRQGTTVLLSEEGRFRRRIQKDQQP